MQAFLKIFGSQFVMILLEHDHPHAIRIIGQRYLVHVIFRYQVTLEITLIGIIILFQAKISIAFSIVTLGKIGRILLSCNAFVRHQQHTISIYYGFFVIEFNFLPINIMKAVKPELVVYSSILYSRKRMIEIT